MDSLPSESTRIQQLVERALELRPDERPAFLQRACENDSLLEKCQAELAAREKTGSWHGSSETGGQANKGNETSLNNSGSTARIPTPGSGTGSDEPTLAHKRERPGNDATAIGAIGEYDLIDEIARGGMGSVYKARHRVLERLVAIKIPHASALEDGEERFLREAKSAAALTHPNVCPIYEVGHTGRHPFIALQFIEGSTLSEWSRKTKPNARVVAETIAKVARAVDYAHGKGVIHRDIKPSNVMLDDATGQPVLMDFGLAKQLTDRDTEVTKDGQVVGTPAYMAPEQAAGRAEQIGPLVDVYALGAVLYVLLTGKPPFEGAAGEVIGKVQHEEPLPPRKVKPQVHRDLETICLKAMNKDPAARYASAAELAEDLERFSAGEPILARRESFVSRTARMARRHAMIMTMAVILLMATGVAGYFAFGSRTARAIASLNESINDRIRQGDWPRSELSELEAGIEELRQYDPSAAETVETRLHRAYADSLQDRIVKPVALTEEDLNSIEARFGWLEERQREFVPPLRDTLKRRMRTWQPAFSLTAPFADYDRLISSDDLELADSKLRRKKYDDRSPLEDGILASEPCYGNVRLQARFDQSWKGASEIGLMLLANSRSGYLFRMRVPAVSKSDTESRRQPFWKLLSEGGQVHLEILRDGRLLRQISIRPHQLHDADHGLTMTATREGERVSFKVGDEPALVFEDLFPHAGGAGHRYGVWWPSEVRIVSLEASRQPLPVAPSPLERGDELFAASQFEAAASHYRDQAGRATDKGIRDQARFKEALCRIRLDEFEAAATMLESVTTVSDERLRLLASCQLWLLRLRQSRYDDADDVFVSLQSQYHFKQLALMVPEEDRREILSSIYRSTTGLNLLQFQEEDLAFLERANNISELLNPNESETARHMRAFQLTRGYHITGEFDKGIQHARRFLNSPQRQLVGTAIGVAMECSWMLRTREQPKIALELLDGMLNKANPRQFLERKELLIERARVHVARGNWDMAAQDLDRYLAIDVNEIEYREFCSACLVRGFIHEHFGDQAAAMAVWNRGLRANWLAERNEISNVGPSMTGMSAMNAIMVGVMSESLNDQETRRLIASAMPIASGGLTGKLIQEHLGPAVPAVKHMNKTQRGREVIRRIAFQQIPLRQYIRDPLALLFLEITRQGAASGDWSAEEEELVWDLAQSALEQYTEGTFAAPQVVYLLVTWKGTTGIFGWQGLAPSLAPEMRGPAAYVFGHRFNRRGDSVQAEKFFRIALDDAEAGSRLEALAKEQIAKLGDDNQE